MKYNSLTETRTGKVFFGLFLFAMLYLCRDSLVTTAILGFTKSYLLSLSLIGILGLHFLWMNRKNLKDILLDKRMIVMALSAAVILLPMLIKQDWQLMYFSILICLLLGVFLTYFISLRDTSKYYVVIVTALGLYAVIATYFLRRLPDSGTFAVPVFHNSLDYKFHNFIFAFVSDTYVKNRNFGIFREPGVYQFFILLALFLNNFHVSWKKDGTMWLVNAVLSLVMLSTFATGGVAELGMLAIFVFFEKKLYKNKWVWAVVTVLAVALVIALWKICTQKGDLYWELYGMLIYKFTINESSSERMDAVLSDLMFFLRSPLWGCGIAQVLHSVENNTTSTMLMLALFGIPGGALHVASWAALVWDKNRKWIANAILLVILMLSFNTQNLIADTFLWLFPMMALTERILPRIDRKE